VDSTRIQVIPRSVLERAHGFAIFTVFKAGFLFSARAGSGIVIARTQDGCEWRRRSGNVAFMVMGESLVLMSLSPAWSPPSAIGLGGFGFGGQAGAEVTDFLIVLNVSRPFSYRALRSWANMGQSRAAVTSFMSAGSLTLGGNMSVRMQSISLLSPQCPLTL
jgi:lipid-binding SYLF domain-containing protein